MGRYIFIDRDFGRFANQLFPIFKALTILENEKYEKIYFKNYFQYKDAIKIRKDVIKRLPDAVKEVVEFDPDKYDEKYSNLSEDDIILLDFCQDLNDINVDVVSKYFNCAESLRNDIRSLYEDVEDLVCIHVRRGDYLNTNNSETYGVLSKEYIIRSMEKYFPNCKFICISDDIKWCKDNLPNEKVIFADKTHDVLTDFYIQTLTKGNICSSSSFSIAGSIINPYRKTIIPHPFFIKDIAGINLIPSWAEHEYR